MSCYAAQVNMIKGDGTVIHFNNPKVQASLSANTFAVTGHAETKRTFAFSCHCASAHCVQSHTCHLVCECNFYWRFLSYFALPWSEMRHPVLWLLAVQLLQRSNCSQTHRWCMTEWDRRMTIDHYSEQRDRTEILTRKDAVLLVFSFALVFGMLASKQQHEQQQLCF